MTEEHREEQKYSEEFGHGWQCAIAYMLLIAQDKSPDALLEDIMRMGMVEAEMPDLSSYTPEKVASIKASCIDNLRETRQQASVPAPATS